MHLMQVVFLAVLLAALTAAFSRGGRHEHIGAALVFVASIVTPMVQRHLFNQVETGIAIVDFLLLAALMWMALSSGRRWPIYAAAFQGLGVLTHFARARTGPVHGDAYGDLLVVWSYLVLFSLLFGSLIEANSKAKSETPLPDNRQSVIPNIQRPPPKLLTASPDDHALLVRLLLLHGLGSSSDSVAQELLERTGSFAAAIATPATRLTSWGIDQRAQDALALARSATRTTLKRKLETRPCLADRQHVVDYLHAELAHLSIEQFRVLYLNARHRLVHEEVHGEGTVNAAPVFPREIVRRAIEVAAVKIILAHNHPGGDATATRDDIQTTRAVIDAARSIDVAVVDHIVISASGHTSMRAAGLI
jgi:DNA repair protein RadC